MWFGFVFIAALLVVELGGCLLFRRREPCDTNE
jgi:hypothetical protein